MGISAKFIEKILHENEYQSFLDEPTGDCVNNVVKPATSTKRCSWVVYHRADSALVGKTTVFFSHAYSYPLRVSLEAMLRYARAHPDKEHFYWYDPVSLNQHHGGSVVPFETLHDGFSAQITDIGEVLALMYPFDAPST